MPPPDLHAGHEHPLIAALDRRRIEALAEPFLPDPEQRAFVLRCILDEGPLHHRGDNYVLLRLLGEVLHRLPPPAMLPAAGPSHPVPMRIPPSHQGPGEARAYPLGIPLAPLALLGPGTQGVFAECLADGPPHHALANALMLQLLQAILARLDAGGSG